MWLIKKWQACWIFFPSSSWNMITVSVLLLTTDGVINTDEDKTKIILNHIYLSVHMCSFPSLFNINFNRMAQCHNMSFSIEISGPCAVLCQNVSGTVVRTMVLNIKAQAAAGTGSCTQNTIYKGGGKVKAQQCQELLFPTVYSCSHGYWQKGIESK